MRVEDKSLEYLACVAGGRAISGDKEEATTAIDKFYVAARTAGLLDGSWFKARADIVFGIYEHRFGVKYAPPILIKVPEARKDFI